MQHKSWRRKENRGLTFEWERHDVACDRQDKKRMVHLSSSLRSVSCKGTRENNVARRVMCVAVCVVGERSSCSVLLKSWKVQLSLSFPFHFVTFSPHHRVYFGDVLRTHTQRMNITCRTIWDRTFVSCLCVPFNLLMLRWKEDGEERSEWKDERPENFISDFGIWLC